MVDGKKQENRGGYRAGAGRKPQRGSTLTATAVAKMLRKARKAAKVYGKDVDDVLLGFVYDEETRTADRLAAIKLWKEYTSAKMTEGGAADKELGPALFLPEQRPRLEAVKAA